MSAEDRIAARLLEALAGLDLTSADGRAGINTLLSEIERACPGAILQQAARLSLNVVTPRAAQTSARFVLASQIRAATISGT